MANKSYNALSYLVKRELDTKQLEQLIEELKLTLERVKLLQRAVEHERNICEYSDIEELSRLNEELIAILLKMEAE